MNNTQQSILSKRLNNIVFIAWFRDNFFTASTFVINHLITPLLFWPPLNFLHLPPTFLVPFGHICFPFPGDLFSLFPAIRPSSIFKTSWSSSKAETLSLSTSSAKFWSESALDLKTIKNPNFLQTHLVITACREMKTTASKICFI